MRNSSNLFQRPAQCQYLIDMNSVIVVIRSHQENLIKEVRLERDPAERLPEFKEVEGRLPLEEQHADNRHGIGNGSDPADSKETDRTEVISIIGNKTSKVKCGKTREGFRMFPGSQFWSRWHRL